MTLPRIDHVAVIGAGFSGTLQAINLLRHDGPRVTLIERRGVVARGTAYSTPNPAHLLNVRATNMSALPDDPTHFVRWRAGRGVAQPEGFASRRDYGDYLGELLAETRARVPGRLDVRHDTATGLTMTGDGASIRFEDGDRLRADVAVLALGNLPPHDPGGIASEALPGDLYISDPWAGDVAAGLSAAHEVLVLGTGLTMVDVVLSLEAAGFGGRIVALSRRGLVPRAHGVVTPGTQVAERPASRGAGLIRWARGRADAVGWRAAVDELRPYTQGMWLSASVEEQSRFLRHLRPWWDVHRHRIAPGVADRLNALRDAGRLTFSAGHLVESIAQECALDVAWRVRGSNQIERRRVRRMINCTGPQGDLLRTNEPLLRQLLAAGHVRADGHRLGIDVNAQAQAIDAAGRANPRLLALGPMTRGTFWEIVAVPDIRHQTWNVARRLAHAQWVEGEGL